jgi:hypothetical protein
MKKSGAAARFASVVLLAGAVGTALGAEISTIQPSAATVSLDRGKAVVRFTVSGTADSRDRCGYFVEYGDGAAGDSRLIDNENGQFNRPHERTFSRPGIYTIRASGKSVKTTGPCNGSTSTTITVVAAAAAAPGRWEERAAAPVCPEGWLLNDRSVNQRTGAFSCTAKPAVQLVCPDGLRYYERDGVIGCRSERRRQ